METVEVEAEAMEAAEAAAMEGTTEPMQTTKVRGNHGGGLMRTRYCTATDCSISTPGSLVIGGITSSPPSMHSRVYMKVG